MEEKSCAVCGRRIEWRRRWADDVVDPSTAKGPIRIRRAR
ncbi:DUF2256 domain-containing protein [Pseudonocardia sp. NPDC046786]